MSPTHYDVFLSRKSQDAHLAKELYDFLTSKGLRVFDSDHSLQEMGNADYSRAIDDALVNTEHLIVVGSSIENISSPWVEAEWRFFLNRKRSGRANGNLLTVITKPTEQNNLPPSLQNFEVFIFGNNVLEKVINYLKQKNEYVYPKIEINKRMDGNNFNFWVFIAHWLTGKNNNIIKKTIYVLISLSLLPILLKLFYWIIYKMLRMKVKEFIIKKKFIITYG